MKQKDSDAMCLRGQSSFVASYSFVAPCVLPRVPVQPDSRCSRLFSSRILCKQFSQPHQRPRAAISDEAISDGPKGRNGSHAQEAASVRRRPRPIKKEIMDAQRLRKQGNWQQAQTLLKAVKQEAEHDPNYLNEMVYVRAAELHDTRPSISAAELYRELHELSHSVPAEQTPKTFNAILLGLRNIRESRDAQSQEPSEKLKEASRLFDTMVDKQLPPDHYTMSILFQMCASEGSLGEAKKFEEKAKRTFGFEANVISGSALLTAYAKCGDIDALERVMKDLQSRSIPLNERTFSSVISAYHRSGKHAKVIEMFHMAFSLESVQPHLFLFSGALASCWRAKDSANARVIFETMETMDIEPTEEVFSTLFEIALRSGDVPLGIQVLLDWAPRYGYLKPTISHFNQVIAACKKSLVSIRRAESCLKNVLKRLKEETDLEPDVEMLNNLISAFLQLGSYAEAQSVLEKDFPSLGLMPNVGTFNILMYGLGKAKGHEYALKVLRVMQNRSVKPNQVTYNTLMNLLLEANEHELISKIMPSIKANCDVVSDSSNLSSQLKNYRMQKDVQAASKLYWKVLDTNDRLDSITHGLMLNIFLENGCEDEAVTLLGWLTWKNMASATAFNAWLSHISKKKDYARCYAIFENMKKKGIAPDEKSYSILISVFSRTGLIDRAFRMLAEMQDVGLSTADTHSWTTLIDACGRVGQWQRAVELLKTMRDSKSRLKFVPAPTTSCYNAAIYATGMRGGGWKDAVEVFELLQADEDQNPDVVTYSAMASVILSNRFQISQWSLAREVFSQLRLCLQEDLDNDAVRAHVFTTPSGRLSKGELKKLSGKLKRLEWLLAQVTDGKLIAKP